MKSQLLLTQGERRPVGLLPPAPKSILIPHLVHQLFESTRRVRRSRNPKDLLDSIRYTKELISLGFLPIFSRKVVGASDQRFKDKEISWMEEDEITLSKKEDNSQWILFQQIQRDIELLSEASQRRLLRELRMAKRSAMR